MESMFVQWSEETFVLGKSLETFFLEQKRKILRNNKGEYWEIGFELRSFCGNISLKWRGKFIFSVHGLKLGFEQSAMSARICGLAKHFNFSLWVRVKDNFID